MSNNTPAKTDFTEEVLSKFVKSKTIEEKTESVYVNEFSKKWNTNDAITNLFRDKIKKDTDLKGKYAIILIVILIFQLVILNVLFILKGRGVLVFSDTTFNIFITGGIAEIFILVKTIVKYLFSDDLTELLKIILKANNYKFRDNKENDNNKNKIDKN